MSEWKRLLVGRFTVLLALLGFNILVLPLLDEGMVGDFIGRAFYSLLFIECADLLRRTGRYFRTGLVLSALALGFGWLVPFWPGPWIYLLQFLFAGTLLFFHAIRLMDAVRKDHLGNEQSIVGALCAYLLLGLAWIMAYSMVCSADPGAFSVRIFDDADGGGVERSRHASFSQLIYFSITTDTSTPRTVDPPQGEPPHGPRTRYARPARRARPDRAGRHAARGAHRRGFSDGGAIGAGGDAGP